MNLATKALSLAILVAGPVLVCTPALAQDTAAACPAVSNVERRIVVRAEGEVESLRSFVGLMAVVYGVNMIDVRDNLDRWRAAVECRKVAAAAAASDKLAQDEAADASAPVHVSQR
jgi:hypothetical protein